MPSPKRPSRESVTIGGRTVRLVRGQVTQTLRVRAAANGGGRDESIYRFGADVVLDPDELSRLVDVAALSQWCTSHGGTPEVPGTTRRAQQVAAPDADDSWVLQATCAVDAAVDSVVDQFLADPYLHRVEHSLHTALWAELKAGPYLQDLVMIGSGNRRTQLVHKEWPETVPGVEGDDSGPRGNFDIAVIAPTQVTEATLDQFREGRIDAPIAIEVGLDYGLPHLRNDQEKLLHSRVPVPYLLHLSRLRVKDGDRQDIEALLCAPSGPLRAAYVHVDPNTGERRFKHVAGTSVKGG